MSRRPEALSLPWAAGDILRLVALATCGLAALGAATIKSSGEHALADQVVWLNLAVGGVVLLGVGVSVFVLNGRRTIGISRRAIADRLDVEPRPARPDIPGAAVRGGGALVAAPGMTRFHRLSCLLVRGKAVEEASAEEHRAHGRTACGMCLTGSDE